MIVIPYESLDEKFALDCKYYWKLYPGQQYRRLRFAANLDNENKDESLAMLHDQLRWVSERYVTVETLSSPVAKNGNVYVIDLGVVNASADNKPAISGQGVQLGYGGAGMNPFQLMERARTDAEKTFMLQMQLLEERMKAQFELKDLQRRLDEAEDALENGSGDFKSRIGNAIADHLPAIVGMFAGGPPPAPAQVGVAGVNTNSMKGESTSQQQQQQQATQQLSLDKMAFDVMQLQQMFPNYNMNDVLHGLVSYAQSNHAQVNALLGMVSKPIG